MNTVKAEELKRVGGLRVCRRNGPLAPGETRHVVRQADGRVLYGSGRYAACVRWAKAARQEQNVSGQTPGAPVS